METFSINARYIGGQIAYARNTLRGWSLQRFSDELSQFPDPGKPDGSHIKVGRAALGKWESGDNQIPARYLVPVAVSLGVTPTWLLIGGGSVNGHSWEQDQLILGDKPVSYLQAWHWALGNYPISDDEDPVSFQRRNRPNDPPGRDPLRFKKEPSLQKMFQAASELRSSGATIADLKYLLEVWFNFTTIAPTLEWDAERGRPTFGDDAG